jgi:hypothetical protein
MDEPRVGKHPLSTAFERAPLACRLGRLRWTLLGGLDAERELHLAAESSTARYGTETSVTSPHAR